MDSRPSHRVGLRSSIVGKLASMFYRADIAVRIELADLILRLARWIKGVRFCSRGGPRISLVFRRQAREDDDRQDEMPH